MVAFVIENSSNYREASRSNLKFSLLELLRAGADKLGDCQNLTCNYNLHEFRRYNDMPCFNPPLGTGDVKRGILLALLRSIPPELQEVLDKIDLQKTGRFHGLNVAVLPQGNSVQD